MIGNKTKRLRSKAGLRAGISKPKHPPKPSAMTRSPERNLLGGNTDDAREDPQMLANVILETHAPIIRPEPSRPPILNIEAFNNIYYNKY